uniref:Ricin B-type lectin domain-containing protein n=1 Tax=Strongyloides papillosus TaxID=174720 RepID=A0A0N5BT94_STREA
MNLYGKAGSILRQISKVPEFVSYRKTSSVMTLKTEDEKNMASGTKGITFYGASTTPNMGPIQSLIKKKMITKTENIYLNLFVLEDEMEKKSNDKKEVYMRDRIRAILSKNTNIAKDKVEKKKFSTGAKNFLSTVCSAVLTSTNGVNIKVGYKPFSYLEFLNFQKPGSIKNTVTFDDVKGMDEAKAELMEIVEYLREPEKYERLGAKLPKGVLLAGPPGTGKTLLARAVAGEANIPFFHKSGSEFGEISVGQGVKRLRDLFKEARCKAPCIIFIDEIDSIGSKRVSNSIDPSANQTINQLLTEMDGFDNSEGIIVIGATNRPEDLDKALIRPGRFDIHVNCSIPDLSGRIEIFKHYLGKIKHRNIDIEVLAKTTIGFSAADISNVVNQAALKAATEGCHHIMQKHIEDAIDRVITGPVRTKGKHPKKESNRNTAYHEAGHTSATLNTPYTTPLHKVTTIPRLGSLGHTCFIPEKDKCHTTKAEILAQINVMMGDRVAEEFIFGKDFKTIGASNDLKKSTSSTKIHTKEFCMGGNIGSRKYKSDICQKSDGKDVSPQATNKAGLKIDKIMNKSYARENSNLTKNEKDHKRSAQGFLKNRKFTAEEVQSIPNGKPPGRKPTKGPFGEMLEGYLASVLNRYVGEYLEDLNTDQLSIALLSGKVELENVPLKRSALSKFDIPIDVKSGVVGKLIVTIPITAIRSEPWIVKLNDVFIILKSSERQYLGKEQDETEIRRKEELFKELEEIHKKILLKRTNLFSGENDKQSQWWGNSIISSIINNIRLIITNIHIRYEDNKTISQDVIFSCGLKIKSINLHTTNDQWEEHYINGSNNLYTYKKLDIDGASFYWNTNETKLSEVETLDDLKNSFLNNNFNDSCYIIQPFELQIKLTKNTSKLNLTEETKPRFQLNVFPKKLAIDITVRQLIQMRALANEFKRFDRARKYRKWRPKEKVSGNSIMWWKFAIDRVIDSIKRKNITNTWDYAISNARDEIKKRKKHEVFKYFDLLNEFMDSQECEKEVIYMKQVERDNQMTYSILNITRDHVCKKIIAEVETYFALQKLDIDMLSTNTVFDVSNYNGVIDIPIEVDNEEKSSTLYKWVVSWFSNDESGVGESIELEEDQCIETDVKFPVFRSCKLPANFKKVENKMEKDLLESLNEMLDDSTIFVRDKILAVVNLNVESITFRILIENYKSSEYNCVSIDLSKVLIDVQLSAREHRTTLLLDVEDFNIRCTKTNKLESYDASKSISDIFDEAFLNKAAQVIFTVEQSKTNIEKYGDTKSNQSAISMFYSRFSPKTTVFHKLNAEFVPFTFVLDESSTEDLLNIFNLFNNYSENFDSSTNQTEDSFCNQVNLIYCHLKVPTIDVVLKTRRKFLFGQSFNTEESQLFGAITFDDVSFGVSKMEEYLTKYNISIKSLCFLDFYEKKFSKLLEIKNYRDKISTRSRSNSFPGNMSSSIKPRRKSSSFSDEHSITMCNGDLNGNQQNKSSEEFPMHTDKNDSEESDDNHFIVAIDHVHKNHHQFVSHYKEVEYNFGIQASYLDIGMNQHTWVVFQDIIGLIPENPHKHDFNSEDDLELQELLLQGLHELDPSFNLDKYQMDSKQCSRNDRLNHSKKILSVPLNVLLGMSFQEVKISMNLPQKELCLGVIHLNNAKCDIKFDINNEEIPMEVYLAVESLKIDNSIPDYNSLYQEALSVEKRNASNGNDSPIKVKILKYRSFDFDLERPYDAKMDIVIDESFEVTYLHLHRFFCLTTDFWVNYVDLIDKMSKKGVAGISDNANENLLTRVSVEANINCPVSVIVPLNQFSSRCIIMKMTKVEATNKFDLASQSKYMNDYVINRNITQDNYDCLFDNMDLLVEDLEIFEGESILVNSKKFSNCEIFLDGLNGIAFKSDLKSVLSKKKSAKIIFGRNLSCFISQNAPNINVIVIFENMDIILTTKFYKLLQGVLQYNLGDYTELDTNSALSENGMNSLSNISEDHLKQNINLSFRMQFTNVDIKLLTPSKSDNYWDNLGIVSCGNAILGSDSYVDCQFEISFIVYHAQLIDKRIDLSGNNLSEEVFSKVLLPKNDFDSSVRQAFLEMNVFFKNNDAPVVTFVLQETQLLVIPDWFLALKEFLLLESDFDVNSEEILCNIPILKDYFKKNVDNSKHENSLNTYEIKHSITMKTQFTDCDIVFIENLSDPKSLALKCFVTSVLQLNDKMGYLSAEFIIQKIQVSWFIFAEESNTNCIISTPFNIEIKLGAVANDISFSKPHYSQKQEITKHYITIKMDNCSFRLSYKDVLVAMNVINGCKRLLDTNLYQLHWAPVLKDEPTAFNTIKIKNINCAITDFSLWILNDFNGPTLPIMRLSSVKWKFVFTEEKFISEGILSIEYFNQRLSGWEPFLEPVEISSFNLEYHDRKSIYSEFKVNPKSHIDINVTTHLIQQLKAFSNEFLNIKSSIDSNFRSLCRKGRNNNTSYIIKNKLGSNINFTTEIDKLLQKDGKYRQNVKWSCVEAEKEIEFFLPVDRNHLYGSDYNSYSRLILSIDGYEELQPINIDTVRTYSINARKNVNSLTSKRLKYVKLLINISISDDGRKAIDVRTAYSITNFLNIPVMLKIDNSVNGSKEWIDVKISPNEDYYIPLKYIYSRIYCRPIFGGKNSLPLTTSDFSEVIFNDEYYKQNEPSSFSRFTQNDKKLYFMLYNHIDGKISNKTIPGLNISIYPPLFIRNQLPTDIDFGINGQNIFCQSGNTISLPNINVDEPVALDITTDRLKSVESLELSRSSILKLQTRYSKPIPITMVDEEKRKMIIYADISLSRNGSIIIVLWVTYWIVNKSGIPLIIRKNESFEDIAGQLLEHEQGNDKIPLMVSFNNDDEEVKRCNLRVGKSFLPDKNYFPEYSEPFKLTPGEQSLALHMKHQNKPTLIYNVGIEVRQGTGRYKNTQVVIFSPRYLLINRSSYTIYLSHIDDITFKRYNIIEPNSNLIWNESFEDNGMICIKRSDVKYWSQPFRIDQVGSYFITMRDIDETPNFVRAETTLSNARFCITFSNTEFYPPPIQIINESSIPVLYQQVSNHPVPSYLRSICKGSTKIDYAWDFIYGQKLLSLQASSYSSHSYDPTKSTVGPSLYYENYSFIFLDSSISGLIRSNTFNNLIEGLVLTVVDSNYVKLMPIDKSGTNLNQLWNFTSEGTIESVALNNYHPNSSTNFVLDLLSTEREFILVVGLRDKTRNKTQLWKFNDDGRFSCGLSNGYLMKSIQNYLTMGFSRNINTLVCSFKRIYQKEGTGILNVQCSHVGPTLVVRISFPDTIQPRESSVSSSSDQKIELNILIPNGIGISLINAAHEELFYGRLKDNQLNGAQNFNFFFCQSTEEKERLSKINENLSQDQEMMLYLTSSAMKIELNYTRKEHYDSFEYFKILFSNISINLDEQLLWKFIEFIQESGTAESVAQINLLQPPNIDLDDVNKISMRRCYFGNLILNIGQISLSVITIPTNVMEKKIQQIKQNFNIRLMSFENASITLPPFIQTHTFETITFLIECLKKFYINELYTQTFNIIVSLDAFGNPLGLATDIKDSFQTLIFDGNVSGFVSGFSYGVANSFSKVMSSMATGVGALITDKEYELKRRKSIKVSQNSNDKNPLTHLYSGFKGLGTGVIGGATAIVGNTMKETRNKGLIVGLVKGVSTGVVDTVAKPVQGVFDFIGGTATAMKEVAGNSHVKKQCIPRERLRLTRVCNNLCGLLQPYKVEYALAQQLISTKFTNFSSKSVLLEIEVYHEQKINNECVQLCALICTDKAYFLQKNNGNYTEIINILDFKNLSNSPLIPKRIEKVDENVKYTVIVASEFDSKINKENTIQIMVYSYEKAQILCDKLNRAKELYDRASKNISY